MSSLSARSVTSSSSILEVEPVGATLGARISNIDLACCGPDEVDAIRHAFDEYSVLVFPNQDLSPSEQIRFTGHFGPVARHPLYRSAALDGHPEILVLDHKDGRYVNGRNDMWHSDITFAEEPPLGSVLYCKQATTGLGDTQFCSMRSAYQNLSPGLKRTLDTLHAEHSAVRMVEINNSRPYNVPIETVPKAVSHPVVRTHPGNGSRGLFVNPIYTLRLCGMTEAESAPLLDHLYEVATQVENIYRHRWQIGDVVMFDNRCTMHYVVPDYGPEIHRLMHRTTAAGERPY